MKRGNLVKFAPKGIIPPVITPLTPGGRVNETMLRKVVNHLIDKGVHGLFPLGTTGEFYALTTRNTALF
jgi:4-hydroxy-tetrahydrodipicolinate synthase